jgi:beta-barrel assembly-enhancing protease
MRRLFCIVALAIAACGAKQGPTKKVCAPNASDADHENCYEQVADAYLRMLLYRNYDNAEVTRYVTAVGQRLARASGDRRPWKFVVLDDNGANAFVTMGSTVYLLRGTLAILRSEAELAGVLAHEIGHLRGGHARERWDEIFRAPPRSAAQQLLDNRYARDDEIQADEHAITLLAKAGYDPRAVGTMLQALAGTSNYDATEDPASVHPWWPERIARAHALVLRRPSMTGELGEARYRTSLATLIDGDDPRRDAVRVGNAVVFANAKVAVDLPAGELIDDPQHKIVLRLPDGARAEITAVPTNWKSMLELFPSTDELTFEFEPAGTELLVFSVEGKNAKAHTRALRTGKRAARPGEIAQVHPRFVSFDAPRRLWTR